MSAQKASRRRRDWYSVSEETLRAFMIILVLVVVLAISFFGYRYWESRSQERDAGEVLDETQGLIQRIQNEPRASGFRSEYDAAWQGFQEARNQYSNQDFRGALDNARRSRNMLMSILDALNLSGTIGQAQFVSIQGDVEYRRGDGGDWQEARSRVPLKNGDYVRTSDNGSAEVMFNDGTLYTVRQNTQFIVSSARTTDGREEQAIQMEFGWVDLNTAQGTSNVKTPNATARVQQDSEAFVAVDRQSSQGSFGAFSGGIELTAKGGLKREVKALEQVVQTGDLLSEPAPLPGRPGLVTPADNVDLDLDRVPQVALTWDPVEGAARYALQVSRTHLFVENIIDVKNRPGTKATLGLRGEGTFQWRVAAFDKGGVQGPWSKPWKFRVASFRSGLGEKDETPPQLDLQDVKSYGSIFIVDGHSEPGAQVEINGEQVKVAADGSFTKTVQLEKEGWSFIEIRARDSWGNQASRRHRVFVENP
ncbi:MAG TPA: FecR domain-containing protein [Thermoanaerobaculia bacterium]|nr:FecR domain-containing protein [Thermoanaerobaculia bacterium]